MGGVKVGLAKIKHIVAHMYVASNQTFVSNKIFISWTLIDSDK